MPDNAMLKASIQQEIEDDFQIQAYVAAYCVTGMYNYRSCYYSTTTEEIELNDCGSYRTFMPGKTDHYLELEKETLHFCDRYNGYKKHLANSFKLLDEKYN